MRSKTSIELFRYWNATRGDRNLPRRDEIAPGDIRSLLPDVFILQRRPDGTIRFRLAGTRICTLFGGELRDQPFSALWQEAEGAEIDEVAGRVMAECSPMLLTAFCRTAAGETLDLELLLAPLASADGKNDRLLGALSPLTRPQWLRMSPITALITTDLRVLPPLSDMSRNDVDVHPAATSVGVVDGGGGTLQLRVLNGDRRD
ncbi:PAS domain-containing protein [Sinorhizobium sojae]|uniref:PAS domain-containing protein n=1 Tax=Sinorhizobium sojae TaxID=716925 RepID=UPI0004BBF350|nr:PAS domain-containing protein [Sinorhizobium sojae]